MKKKPSSLNNGKELAALLTDIENDLVKEIPAAVRAEKIKKRSYGILLCYIDFTTDAYTPFAVVLPESHRQECIANRSVESIWTICAVPGQQCDIAKKSAVHEKCDRAYRYLQEKWSDQDELRVLMPFRKMFYRVCLRLNELDWSAILPVTEDFVVVASDWSEGCDIVRDAKASVPHAKQERLKDQGLFFNPSKLPKVALPSSSQLKTIAKKSVDEQIVFWVSELDAQFHQRDCESSQQGVGPKQIAKKLSKIGSPAAEALLDFIAAKADTPEWTTKVAEPQFYDQSPRSKLVENVMEVLIPILPKTAKTESRLWKIFDVSVKTNKPSKHWGNLPALIAFGIQEIFSKYSYWVVRGRENVIESMDEISAQRASKGPKNS